MNIITTLVLAITFAGSTCAQTTTKLHRAVSNHQLFRIRQLIDFGADVNAVDGEHMTPLFLAARSAGDSDIVRILLEHHADVSIRCSTSKYSGIDGFAPIDVACDTAMSALLEQHGGNLRLAPDHGWHVMMYCIKTADTASFAYFLRHGADIQAREQSNNDAPLTFSALKDASGTIVKFLVDHGLGMNAPDHEGRTAIFQAMFDTTGQQVDMLARNGADLNVNTYLRMTPLMWVCRVNNGKGLNRNDHDQSDRLTLMRRLLRDGADPNRRDQNGETVLFNAVQDGDEDIVRLLLDYHADVQLQTRYGETIVHLAAGGRYDPRKDSAYWAHHMYEDTTRRNLIALLVEHGAHASLVTQSGETPIFFAAWQGFIETCRYLIAHGDNINNHNRRGETPLAFVGGKHQTEVIRDLISLGADVNARDASQHATPLHHAICDLDIDLVAALLANGANINAVDDSNQTPLFYATSLPTTMNVTRMPGYASWDSTRIETEKKNLRDRIADDCKIVGTLLEHGADVSVKDVTGKTAADVVEAEEVGAVLKNGKR